MSLRFVSALKDIISLRFAALTFGVFEGLSSRLLAIYCDWIFVLR